MTADQLDQIAQGMRFAGLTPGQTDGLRRIVEALKEMQERAKPFAVLAERYEAYCRDRADVPRWDRMDFTAWLDQRGEDPDVLLGQFRAMGGDESGGNLKRIIERGVSDD